VATLGVNRRYVRNWRVSGIPAKHKAKVDGLMDGMVPAATEQEEVQRLRMALVAIATDDPGRGRVLLNRIAQLALDGYEAQTPDAFVSAACRLLR